jgi:hypothetical protein
VRIAAVDPGVTLVVQPVTPRGGVGALADAPRLLALVASLGERLERVRLIPQTHPLLKLP